MSPTEVAPTLAVINPNTGRTREVLPTTPPAAIPALVAKARQAQPAWAALPFAERAEALRRAAKDWAAEAEALALHVHEEMGKPLSQAKGEVLAYAEGVEDEIEAMATALIPESSEFAEGRTSVHYVALGVAAVITPWNFPFGMPLTLLVPALLAGNSVVFKPSEVAPRTGIHLAEILARHLPAGVLETVVGAGPQGAELTKADVDLIAFVGSRDTGKKIMKIAADRIVRVLLELGGKDPMLVAADADLEAAAKFAARASLRNSGQVCCSVERIYVERAALPQFLEKVTAEVAKVAVGEERDGAVMTIGPMSSERQLSLVQTQLAEAVAAGAKLVSGGERLARDGFWLQPAVITEVTDSMDIMNSETFGPVVCIQEVETLDEAVQKANRSRYGLAGTVWTKNPQRGEELALKLETGLIGINRSFGGGKAPWAGTKESGLGHTGGVSGARHFLQPRSVTVAKS